MSIQSLYPALKPSLNLDFASVKALDPRITFSRASTATFYDGKTVALAEQNLLTYSQEFDNAVWGNGSASITANAATSPSGEMTADKIIGAAVLDYQRRRYTTAVSADGRFSVSAKQAEYKYLWLGVSDAATAIFDLSTGTVYSGTGTIVVDSNGYYRCSIAYPAGSSYPYIGVANNSAATRFTGDGTSGIYIWGAQLEQRSAVSSYTPTTSQPITNYIPVLQTAAANVARFDHNPTTGESLGLLIEEQRTNLLTYSEQFDNAAWAKVNTTVTANTVVAPDGTLTGDKVVETTANDSHRVYQTPFQAAGTYTYSVYAKAGGRTVAQLIVNTTPQYPRANFDLANGMLGSTTNCTATITNVGNGWYRCSITFTANSTVAAVYVCLATSTTAGDFLSYTGDGYSGVYIWGAQCEAGSFPTSYIPTTSAQVTRSADAASMTGTNFSSWYNYSESSMAFDYSTIQPTGWSGAYDFFGNKSFQGIYWGTSFGAYASSGGGVTGVATVFANGSLNKTAIGFTTTNNTCTVAANGSITTGSPNIVSMVPTRLDIGTSAGDIANSLWVRRIAYYPARLTNTQLQSLTA